MSEETAKKVWEHLSKSGPAASVGISAALLYFAGTVWSCLGCGPVRTIILTIVAWFSQCFILYSAARQECGAKINSETAGKVAIRALYPTVAFIVGYVIVPLAVLRVLPLFRQPPQRCVSPLSFGRGVTCGAWDLGTGQGCAWHSTGGIACCRARNPGTHGGDHSHRNRGG